MAEFTAAVILPVQSAIPGQCRAALKSTVFLEIQGQESILLHFPPKRQDGGAVLVRADRQACRKSIESSFYSQGLNTLQ